MVVRPPLDLTMEGAVRPRLLKVSDKGVPSAHSTDAPSRLLPLRRTVIVAGPLTRLETLTAPLPPPPPTRRASQDAAVIGDVAEIPALLSEMAPPRATLTVVRPSLLTAGLRPLTPPREKTDRLMPYISTPE